MNIKKKSKAIAFGLLALWIASSCGLFLNSVLAASPVPGPLISLANNNSFTSPTDSPANVSFNPYQYTTQETADLGNVRFYSDASLTHELHAWCESGCTNTVSISEWWVNLGNITVPAHSILTLYVGFLPVGTQYDGVYSGEAPQLSSTYGQYDNGKYIFPVYTEFLTMSDFTALFTAQYPSDVVVSGGILSLYGHNATTTNTITSNGNYGWNLWYINEEIYTEPSNTVPTVFCIGATNVGCIGTDSTLETGPAPYVVLDPEAYVSQSTLPSCSTPPYLNGWCKYRGWELDHNLGSVFNYPGNTVCIPESNGECYPSVFGTNGNPLYIQLNYYCGEVSLQYEGSFSTLKSIMGAPGTSVGGGCGYLNNLPGVIVVSSTDQINVKWYAAGNTYIPWNAACTPTTVVPPTPQNWEYWVFTMFFALLPAAVFGALALEVSGSREDFAELSFICMVIGSWIGVMASATPWEFAFVLSVLLFIYEWV